MSRLEQRSDQRFGWQNPAACESRQLSSLRRNVKDWQMAMTCHLLLADTKCRSFPLRFAAPPTSTEETYHCHPC